MAVSTGSAKLWPFAVNWANGYRVNLSYKTDVWASRSGKEQRRALRSTPRKSVEFTSMVTHSELRSFRALMASWQNKTMIMPDVSRRLTLAGASADSALAVEVSETADWVVADATVVLVNGNRREICNVESVSGTTITFKASSAAWPAGTLVHPGLAGVLAQEMQATLYTDSVSAVSVKFDVEPASEPARVAGLPLSTLAGREVLTLKPNWGGTVLATYQYPRELVDYGRGVTATFRPINFATQIFKATYVAETPARITELQQFFERQSGRRGEFHLSTGINDLALGAAALGGTFFLTVAGQEVYTAYAQDTVHRAIEVVMTDGRRFYRKLVDTDPLTTSGADTLLQVAEAWPYDLDPASVARISWLPVARFAGDDITLEYLTAEVGQTQMNFQTLETLTAE